MCRRVWTEGVQATPRGDWSGCSLGRELAWAGGGYWAPAAAPALPSLVVVPLQSPALSCCCGAAGEGSQHCGRGVDSDTVQVAGGETVLGSSGGERCQCTCGCWPLLPLALVRGCLMLVLVQPVPVSPCRGSCWHAARGIALDASPSSCR